MKLSLKIHPGARSDLITIMAYYETESGPRLANDFYESAREAFLRAENRPTHFAPDTNSLRRVNFRRFPYHALFRIQGERIHIYVIRHHRKHPSFGLSRAE